MDVRGHVRDLYRLALHLLLAAVDDLLGEPLEPLARLARWQPLADHPLGLLGILAGERSRPIHAVALEHEVTDEGDVARLREAARNERRQGRIALPRKEQRRRR